MLTTEPHAPALGSIAPITSLDTLASTIAPAHMLHGSSVTYTVHPVSHFAPSFSSAAARASISACADELLMVSTRLCALLMISPSLTTSAPTGTSPARAACSASSSASRMNNSSSERTDSSKTIAVVLYHKAVGIINNNKQKVPLCGRLVFLNICALCEHPAPVVSLRPHPTTGSAARSASPG